MRLEDLTGRRVALLGLGRDVQAAVPRILGSEPLEVVVVDAALSESQVEVAQRPLDVYELRAAVDWAEVFVRSPGFPRYQPELAEALRAGASMTTPLDLFMGTVGHGQRVVMITGTKGKSTTTELIGVFADLLGVRVGVAGNLGIPVFDPGWDSAAPTIVLEVSSYQASDLHFPPDIAVVASIAEDHLSWHGGLDRYLADKLRVVTNDGGTAGRVLVPTDELRAREVLTKLAPTVPTTVVDTIDPVDASDALDIPVHRLRNASLAAAVVTELGFGRVRDPDVVAAARTGMPGRLDLCPSPPGWSGSIRFIDDTLGSNPSATAAGLAWARRTGSDTVVLLGGSDRGVSLEPLQSEVASWLNDRSAGTLSAVALPEIGRQIAAQCGIELIAHTDSVPEAVGVAAAALRSGGIVLFSPAAPTPSGQGNWQTRSKEFREAVMGLDPI